MNKKSLLFGIILPILLVGSGVALVILLQVPEPEQAALPHPDDEAALLQYLPIAEVAEVKMLSEPLKIDVTGTVVPYREVQLAAEVAGKIVEKTENVRSGNYVSQGQVLYRIDARDYELDVERLTRRREQELAAIDELEQNIENVKSLVEVAKKQLELAEAEVKRFESLGPRISSAAELDAARRAQLSSMNQLVTYENQIRSFETQRARLDLAAKLAQTELEQARLDLDRTLVKAPVSGRVVSESVEVDSYVQRGAPLLVIEDTEKVEVACNLRMDQLSWLLEKPNLSADQLLTASQKAAYELQPTPADVQFRITGRDNGTFIWDGVVDRIEGVGLDPQSRTIPIRILVNQPTQYRTPDGSSVEATGGPPMLVRGMFVDVTLKANPTTRLLLVPKLSIKPASENSVIWKFSKDGEVIRQTPQALAAIKAFKEAQANGTLAELYGSDSDDDGDVADMATPVADTALDPQQWQAGRLQVIDEVRMVTSYWDDQAIEYWVCEVPSKALNAGDKVIITPLPGVKADGSDAVRVKLLTASQSTEFASARPNSG